MKEALTAVSLTALALVVAPASYAAPGDADFVQQLSAAGITLTDPPSLVGNAGRNICELLKSGWAVGTALYSAQGLYPQLTESQARTFVLLSHKNYCPDA
jgi:hypothetical protein